MRILVLFLFLGLGNFLVSCASRPSADQLSTLDAALRSAEPAEAELSSLESEYSQLESELEREKQILAENENELEIVRGKMGN